MPTFSPNNLERISNIVAFARKVKTVKTAYTVASKIINVVFPMEPATQSVRRTRSTKSSRRDRRRVDDDYEKHWEREEQRRSERRRLRRRDWSKEGGQEEVRQFLRPQEYSTGYDKWRSERRFDERQMHDYRPRGRKRDSGYGSRAY